MLEYEFSLTHIFRIRTEFTILYLYRKTRVKENSYSDIFCGDLCSYYARIYYYYYYYYFYYHQFILVCLITLSTQNTGIKRLTNIKKHPLQYKINKINVT